MKYFCQHSFAIGVFSMSLWAAILHSSFWGIIISLLFIFLSMIFLAK